MTIYGIVVERRVRVLSGFKVEGSWPEARDSVLKLAEDALPGKGTGNLHVVSVEEFATEDEAARWAAQWDVPPAAGRALDVEAIP